MTIRLYMAPLRGLTDSIYRNTFNTFFGGFDVAVAPFISTMSTKKIKLSCLKDVLPENNVSMALIPQLLSKSPEDFIVFANRLYEMGYETINWNLGCPYPMVAKKNGVQDFFRIRTGSLRFWRKPSRPFRTGFP